MTLPAQLTHLEAAGLIRLAAASPDLAYIFQHALTRDAAYTSLLRSQRRAVHRAAGEVLETLFTTAAQRAAAAPLLAEHWAEAGEPARALDLWELAADQALAQYALPEAIAHLAQALALAPLVPALPLARWAALYCKRGRAQYSNTEWQASWDTHTALLALGERLGDDAVQLAALLELANQRAAMNPLLDPALAHALGEQALSLARQLGDGPAEARAWWIIMRACSHLDDTPEALAAGEQALALARAHGPAEQVAYTLSDMQYAFRRVGQNARAQAVLAEARLYWRSLPQHHMLADNLNQSASLALVLGDYPQVERAAAEALALSAPTHNLAQIPLSQLLLTLAALHQGHFGRALDLVDALTASDIGWYAVPLLGVQAIVWDSLGRGAAALAVLQSALASGADHPFLFGPLSYLAYLYAQAGRRAEAESALSAARTLPSSHSTMSLSFYGYHFALAEAALALDRRDWVSAQAIFQAALHRIAALDVRGVLAEVQWRQGQALAVQGAPEAEAVLTQAVETAERYGQRRVAWQAWHTLAEWQAAHGQPAAAAVSLARARAHVAFIVESLPDAATRTPFLNLPDVQAVLHSAL